MKQGKWRDYASELTAASKENKEGMCCITDAVATVDLPDNTLAVFTQTPRKTIPSQEFEEDACEHACTSAQQKQTPEKFRVARRNNNNVAREGM